MLIFCGSFSEYMPLLLAHVIWGTAISYESEAGPLHVSLGYLQDITHAALDILSSGTSFLEASLEHWAEESYTNFCESCYHKDGL
jgi:hypothetical protein